MIVGTIEIEAPMGSVASISVSLCAGGEVDIFFKKASGRESLTRLPHNAAKRLSELLAAACKCSAIESDRVREAIRASIKVGAPGLTDIVVEAIVRSAMLKIDRHESSATQRG